VPESPPGACPGGSYFGDFPAPKELGGKYTGAQAAQFCLHVTVYSTPAWILADTAHAKAGCMLAAAPLAHGGSAM